MRGSFDFPAAYFLFEAREWLDGETAIEYFPKLKVAKEPALSSLTYTELYERLFDHFSDQKNEQHYYNVLLVAATVQCIAVDTSVCERGFSLMNNLKTMRRSRMRNELLRILMTICSLGEEWLKDPSTIPIDKIVDRWRESSARGRYEAAMWRAAGLEEPRSGTPSGEAGPSWEETEGGDEVDQLTAGGVFQWLGRNSDGS